MKRYEAFEHPTLGHQAVKIGWSWPAFFFGFIWAFVKGLWLPGIAVMILSLTLAAYWTSVGAFGLPLVWVLMGIVGNRLLARKMARRGYRRASEVYAETPQGALAEAFQPASS